MLSFLHFRIKIVHEYHKTCNGEHMSAEVLFILEANEGV